MGKQLENTRIVIREIDTNSGETIDEIEYSSIGVAYTRYLEYEYSVRYAGYPNPYRLVVCDDTHDWDITNIQARER